MIIDHLRSAMLRLRWVFNRHAEDADLDEELRFHRDMLEDAAIAAGHDPADARRAAVVRLGNRTSIRERSRESWVAEWVRSSWQDLRYGARGLRRSPGFTTVVTLTMAAGIGATSAVFGVARWALAGSAPGVTNADKLITLRVLGRFDGMPGAQQTRLALPVSQPTLFAWRRRARSVEVLTSYQSADVHIALPGVAEPQRVLGELVADGYVEVLGLRAEHGRRLVAEDFDPIAAPAVMVSHRFWRDVLGGRASVIGGKILVNGRPATLVGVMPRGFRGPHLPRETDVWFPITQARTLVPDAPANLLTSIHSPLYFQLIARPAPGQADTAVARELTAIARQPDVDYPDHRFGRGVVEIVPQRGLGLAEHVRGRVVETMKVLTALVGLALLVTLANLANIFLARSVSRRGEFQIRLALGASRGRLTRQHAIEAMVYALVGGTAALAAARLLLVALGQTKIFSFLPSLETVRFDWGVAGFTLVCALLIGILVGLVGSLSQRRLSAAAPTIVTPSRYGTLLRSLLVSAQLAASLVGLVGAGLLVRTLIELRSIDLGLDPRGVLTASLDGRVQGYTGPQMADVVDRIRQRVAQLPGVVGIGVISVPLFQDLVQSTTLWRTGGDSTRRTRAILNSVTPGTIEALGLPVRSGHDLGSVSNEVLINEALALSLFQTRDAVGRSIRFRGDTVPASIAGVVANARMTTPTDTASPAVFRLLESRYPYRATLVIRTLNGSAALAPAVRRIARDVDPRLPIFDLRTLESQIDSRLAEQRLVAQLAAVFAGLALLLAVVGLFGVLSFVVSERRREIGLRVALGASPAAICWLIARFALVIGTVGLTLGLGGAWALARGLAGRLYHVTPLDGATFVVAIGALAVSATVAVAIPALSAIRADPLIVIRE